MTTYAIEGADADDRPQRLDGDAITLLFDTNGGGAPTLLYAGLRLAADEDLDALRQALRPMRHASQPDRPSLATLWPQAGRGYLGLPALSSRRNHAALTLDLTCDGAVSIGDRRARVGLCDTAAGVRVTIDWRICAGDVVRAAATIENSGTTVLAIDRIASLALPLPGWATHATRFHGRWASEMQHATAEIPYGRTGGESRGGRPGFGGANWLIAHPQEFGTDHGNAIALHLAWSGDHETVVERDADGTTIQIGLRLDQGEIVLPPGASFTTPEAVMAVVGGGRNGVRQALHSYLRADVLPTRRPVPARPVHLNSWEALAFDIDEAKLKRLASDAAAIGVERFVVDDGWFSKRANDRTSLGDWVPDAVRFPHGLSPVVEHVRALGMDFGLWVEPEMISPDSDLYRAHPDWCLHRPGFDRPTQRHQLVLDLARPDVGAYVFDMLARLLSAHPIGYLKWDHNRELFPNDGAGHRQTTAFYALLDRLRAAYPELDIESCASGGARIDYALLARCHRVWPSDNNDAIERLAINNAWNLFLPPEVMGNHVGPSPNPITGRVLPMAFRAKIAMFGHMGVEADPAAMSEADREVLSAHIACYKAHRDILHNGQVRELLCEEGGVFGTMVEHEGRALALVARNDMAIDYNSRPIHFPGLGCDRFHRVTFPLANASAQRSTVADRVLSGRFLAEAGIILPLSRPASACLVHFERVDRTA